MFLIQCSDDNSLLIVNNNKVIYVGDTVKVGESVIFYHNKKKFVGNVLMQSDNEETLQAEMKRVTLQGKKKKTKKAITPPSEKTTPVKRLRKPKKMFSPSEQSPVKKQKKGENTAPKYTLNIASSDSESYEKENKVTKGDKSTKDKKCDDVTNDESKKKGLKRQSSVSPQGPQKTAKRAKDQKILEQTKKMAPKLKANSGHLKKVTASDLNNADKMDRIEKKDPETVPNKKKDYSDTEGSESDEDAIFKETTTGTEDTASSGQKNSSSSDGESAEEDEEKKTKETEDGEDETEKTRLAEKTAKETGSKKEDTKQVERRNGSNEDDEDQLYGPDYLEEAMEDIGDNIFCRMSDYKEATKEARTVTAVARNLLVGVFKTETLLVGTMTGKSTRVQGSKGKQQKVTRLNDKAKDAIIKFSMNFAKLKNWEQMDERKLKAAMGQKLVDFRREEEKNRAIQKKDEEN